MASEGFTLFKHLPLDIIALHDTRLIMSILLFPSFFVYLLLSILLLYLTKSHVCWSCTQRRKKLISCKIVDEIVLSYLMRRKTERKYFCSVHAKSFTTLQILSFFSRI